MQYERLRCPVCDGDFFSVQYTTDTLLWSPTIYKDGKVVSTDPNWHTAFCLCLNCGNTFIATEHNGEMEVIKS